MTSSRDAWVLAALLADQAINGELDRVSRRFDLIARRLADLAPDARSLAWGAFLDGQDDRVAIGKAVVDADPNGPPPEAASVAAYATLADIARVASDQDPLWPGWINRGVLNVVAAEPGTGKTRFALDLARRIWLAELWPDGQPINLPKGTRTLWIPGDRNFVELLSVVRNYGMPDDAVALGSSPDDPTGCLDLDDPDTLEALSERVQAASPAMVVIDTVGMVTSKNLCRPEDAREFFGPLMELAARSNVAFLGLTHLSANKEALGRRIVEKARSVIKMTQPDPEGQPNRRRLWVDKTALVKPSPLGISMGDAGNLYDFNPPFEPETFKTPGRPPVATEAAETFILKALAERDDRKATELQDEWISTGGSKAAFWRARDALVKSGSITCEGKPLVLHAVSGEAEE